MSREIRRETVEERLYFERSNGIQIRDNLFKGPHREGARGKSTMFLLASLPLSSVMARHSLDPTAAQSPRQMLTLASQDRVDSSGTKGTKAPYLALATHFFFITCVFLSDL